MRCLQWFDKKDIDVDHRIPKKQGGTDSLSNLQAMCKHCNRSKHDNVTKGEVATTLFNSAVSGELGDTLKSVGVQQLKNALGIKYKRK